MVRSYDIMRNGRKGVRWTPSAPRRERKILFILRKNKILVKTKNDSYFVRYRENNKEINEDEGKKVL